MEELVSRLIKKTLVGAETLLLQISTEHIFDRRPSPTYNFNRSSINYSNHASKDIGDMIDEMHQMLTEIEKRRRKLEEIIEIAHKYQPFPIQTSLQ